MNSRILAIVTLLAAPLVAEAAHCSHSSHSVCSSCAKAVRHHAVKEVIVERQVAYATPVVQNVYYSVGASARDYAIAPRAVMVAQAGEIKRSIARLQDQLADYTEEQQSYAQPQQQAYYAPQQQRQSYVQPSQLPAYTQPQRQEACPGGQQCPSNGDRPTFSQEQRPSVMDQACVQCHNDRKANGDLNMQRPLQLEQKVKALHKAMTGEMPKDGQRLSGEELRRMVDELLEDDERRQLLQVLDDRREEPNNDLPAQQPTPPQAPPQPNQDLPEPEPAEQPAQQPTEEES